MTRKAAALIVGAIAALPQWAAGQYWTDRDRRTWQESAPMEGLAPGT
jgi:hypothetical protein